MLQGSSEKSLNVNTEKISLNSAGSSGFRPSGSQVPRYANSPVLWSLRMLQGSSEKSLNVNTEKISGMATAKTAMPHHVSSGVAWNATNDGVSMSPPNSGWNCSASGYPSAASMATRQCFSSTSR